MTSCHVTSRMSVLKNLKVTTSKHFVEARALSKSRWWCYITEAVKCHWRTSQGRKGHPANLTIDRLQNSWLRGKRMCNQTNLQIGSRCIMEKYYPTEQGFWALRSWCTMSPEFRNETWWLPGGSSVNTTFALLCVTSIFWWGTNNSSGSSCLQMNQ